MELIVNETPNPNVAEGHQGVKVERVVEPNKDGVSIWVGEHTPESQDWKL